MEKSLQLESACHPQNQTVHEDEELLYALKHNHPDALLTLFNRYGPYLERILIRVMGFDQELEDLLHDVFSRAIKSVHQVRQGIYLKTWLTRVALNTVRSCLKKRTRRRWLRFYNPSELPEISAPYTSEEDLLAVRATYRLLDKLSYDLRVTFSLRYIEKMNHNEIASLCNVSLSTVKRRLAQAEKKFFALAQREPVLECWLKIDSK